MLEIEIKCFQDNLSDWLTCRPGQFVLIKENEIKFFNSFDAALTEATRLYGLDFYLIRCIVPKQEEIIIPALTLGLLNANFPHSIES